MQICIVVQVIWRGVMLVVLGSPPRVANPSSRGPRRSLAWNQISYQWFCDITENWRGRSLLIHRVIVDVIANTATNKGLCIEADLDAEPYPTGVKVTATQMKSINAKLAKFYSD